jgi:hypothetical protein
MTNSIDTMTLPELKREELRLLALARVGSHNVRDYELLLLKIDSRERAKDLKSWPDSVLAEEQHRLLADAAVGFHDHKAQLAVELELRRREELN